jgi:hypothetical protein
MRRSVLATVTAGCLAAAVTPVLAGGNPADTGRFAATGVAVALPDGDTLSIDLRAADLSGGARLIVDAQRCDADGGCSTHLYTADLAGSALSVDPNTATASLSTVIAGLPLTVSWRPDDSKTAEVGGFDASGGGPDTTADEWAGTPALVRVALGDAECSGSGGVGNGVVVDTGGGLPLARLRLPADPALTC